ncbi:MAG: hypothetical protein U9N14_01800 [Pseudomonadota bacterium]|nr:hypothetical protein [Pseudomonadota bacterium]
MIHIIISVMSVAVVAGLLVAGFYYLHPTAGLREKVAVKTIADMTTLESGYHAYKIQVKQPPSTIAWETQLTPGIIAMPDPPVDTMNWSYDIVAAGNWFCLKGSVHEPVYKGLVSASGRLNATRAFVSGDCGAVANGAEPVSWPSVVALTYWVD